MGAEAGVEVGGGGGGWRGGGVEAEMGDEIWRSESDYLYFSYMSLIPTGLCTIGRRKTEKVIDGYVVFKLNIHPSVLVHFCGFFLHPFRERHRKTLPMIEERT